MLDKTAERVGNSVSADNGRFGITGFKKKHVKVIGNKIHLEYVGKSAVEHTKSFSDERIAKLLKKAIKNTPSEYVFMTSDGFQIRADRVNRYLSDFGISAKDIRGHASNKWMIDKLKNQDIPKEEKERKKLYLKTLREVAQKVGHGGATLRKHYVIPELETKYIQNSEIIDISNREKYEDGGGVDCGCEHDFDKWFKGSKVVDSEGNALVVYHGAYELDPTKLKSKGFFFTDNKENAKSYHNRNNTDNKKYSDFIVKPYYLSLKNPLIIDCEGRNYKQAVVNKGVWNEEYKDTDTVVNEAYQSGKYDGVTFYNIVDTAHPRMLNTTCTTYVVFDQSQIKVSYKLEDGGDFENSGKSGNFTKNITKNEIEHIISGTSEVTKGAAIKAASSYLRRSNGSSSETKESKFFKKQETEHLKSYIRANNLWVSPSDFKNYLSEGAEQKVYLIDEKNVIKTNDSIFYNSWEDYFHSLLLHNYFFPFNAYELIGFTEKNDVLYSVVKQPFIKETQKTDLEFVKKFMEENGFKNTKNNDYFNSELGLILEDLHDENVLTREGVLHFIDTVFYISKPPISNEQLDVNGDIQKSSELSKKSSIFAYNDLMKSEKNQTETNPIENNKMVQVENMETNIVITDVCPIKIGTTIKNTTSSANDSKWIISDISDRAVKLNHQPLFGKALPEEELEFDKLKELFEAGVVEIEGISKEEKRLLELTLHTLELRHKKQKIENILSDSAETIAANNVLITELNDNLLSANMTIQEREAAENKRLELQAENERMAKFNLEVDNFKNSTHTELNDVIEAARIVLDSASDEEKEHLKSYVDALGVMKEMRDGGSLVENYYKKTINLGKIDANGRGRKSNAVDIEVEIKNRENATDWATQKKLHNVPELIISGAIWNERHTDWQSGGQNSEEISKLFPNNAKVQRLVEIWEQYHLNDMRAGSKKQTEALEGLKYEGNDLYDAEKKHLKSKKLLVDNGYEYSSAWLYQPLPQSIIDEVKQLAEELDTEKKMANGGSIKDSYNGRYVTLEETNNGLVIKLDENGKEQLADVPEEGNLENMFDDLFEDIQVNSDWKFFVNIGDVGLGMSEAPAITKGYEYDDNGELEESEGAELYYYDNYQIKDFVRELKENGEVTFSKASSMEKGGALTVDYAEVSGIKRNIMGTTSFNIKLKGMRKPQDFIVYPITPSDSNKIITVQSDTRIGQIDLNSGEGKMSQSHSSGAYFTHLSLDKKTPFKLKDIDLQALKMHIFTSSSKNAGESGVMYTDNSGAKNVLKKGGSIKKVKLTLKSIDEAMKGGFFLDENKLQILHAAEKEGYVLRPSHTQVEWTEKGAKKFFKKVKNPKYKLRQKVYSWQNPDVKREISHINKSDNALYSHRYKVSLRDKDGYSHSSKWMGEDSLSKTPIKNK